MTSSNLPVEVDDFHRHLLLIPGPTWTIEAAAATTDLPAEVRSPKRPGRWSCSPMSPNSRAGPGTSAGCCPKRWSCTHGWPHPRAP